MANSDSITGAAKSHSTRTAFIKLLRPRQWTKNLIAFAPALFAGVLNQPAVALNISFCVMALCCISGSVYVFNDILDVEADRKHPTKCKRPIASGQITVKAAFTIGMLSLLLSFLLAYLVRPALCLVILAYIVLQVAYVTKLKHRIILDVFSISAGFVLRAVAGAASASAINSSVVELFSAIGIPGLVGSAPEPVILSPWFLLCTSMGALFLALEKRRQEYRTLGDEAAAHRKVLGKYSLALIGRMEAVIVPSLVTSYCLYTFHSSYGQWMMITIPPVIYGILRYMVLSEKDTSTGTPEEVLLKDRPIQNTVIIWVVLCALVVYGKLDFWFHAIVRAIDGLRLH